MPAIAIANGLMVLKLERCIGYMCLKVGGRRYPFDATYAKTGEAGADSLNVAGGS